MEIHQKKAGPDYHRFKTMVKRSIEREIRNKNFGARSGKFEKKAVVGILKPEREILKQTPWSKSGNKTA